MAIIKLTDIEKKFTELVNQRLSEGYRFYFYSGSQGEEFKVTLTKDEKTVRMIYAIEKHEWDNGRSTNTFHIIEEEFKPKSSSTLWFGKGELITDIRWFIYNRYRNEIYTETQEELEDLESIQHERFDIRFKMEEHTKYAKLECSQKNVKIALKLVQKQKGFKSATAKSIMEIKRNINMKRYEITVNRGNGNQYVFIKM